MTHATRQPFTYEDHRLLPEDGKRYELTEGALFVSPSPNTGHQTVSPRLQFELMKQLEHAVSRSSSTLTCPAFPELSIPLQPLFRPL